MSINQNQTGIELLPLSEIEFRLKKRFPDGLIAVRDMTGSGDHIEVFVRSSEFKTLSRVARHQCVMGLFDVELKSGAIHALAVKTESE